MAHLLEINHLNAWFGDTQVLSDISVHIHSGEKLALVGESGSGKTVLAQALIRLNPAVRLSGSLKFAGEELIGAPEGYLRRLRGRRIGMIFQEPMSALNPIQKVGKQIAEVYRLHLGYTAAQAAEALRRLLLELGLEDPVRIADAYPFQLSGGQRQRVMIAMAVAAEPELLIADEPTTALDRAVQAQILALLNRLQRDRDMTMLYISHDLRQVARFADRVAVMQAGRIVESGCAEAVFRQPEHPYTRLLADSVPPPKPATAAEETQEMLHIQHLSVCVSRRHGWFGRSEKIILHPVSLSLKRGETLGIIGESGSGKTTLARALMRLIPASGTWRVAGQTWSDLSAKRLTELRGDMQMVFQDPFSALNPRMTIGDIIAEPLLIHAPQLDGRARAAQVAQWLEEVGLPVEAAGRWPHEFSGGQRQRIAIARALIVRPQVVILDEPTSALDVSLQRQMLLLLQKLRQEHRLSMVIISHDLGVIRAMADKVLVLKDGQMVEYGDAAQVFAFANAAYTQNLLQYDCA